MPFRSRPLRSSCFDFGHLQPVAGEDDRRLDFRRRLDAHRERRLVAEHHRHDSPVGLRTSARLDCASLIRRERNGTGWKNPFVPPGARPARSNSARDVFGRLPMLRATGVAALHRVVGEELDVRSTTSGGGRLGRHRDHREGERKQQRSVRCTAILPVRVKPPSYLATPRAQRVMMSCSPWCRVPRYRPLADGRVVRASVRYLQRLEAFPMSVAVAPSSVFEKLGLKSVNAGACTGPNGWFDEPGATRLTSVNPATGEDSGGRDDGRRGRVMTASPRPRRPRSSRGGRRRRRAVASSSAISARRCAS